MDAKADGRLPTAAQKKHIRWAMGVPVFAGDVLPLGRTVGEVCPELAERGEDVLLAVGDLHVANFGVWADSRHGTSGGSTTSTKRANCLSRAIPCGSRPAPCSPQLRRTSTCRRPCVRAASDRYRTGLCTGQPILVTERHPALVTLTKGTQEDPRTSGKRDFSQTTTPRWMPPPCPQGSRTCFAPHFDPTRPLRSVEQRSPGGLAAWPAALSRGDEEAARDAREAKALCLPRCIG